VTQSISVKDVAMHCYKLYFAITPRSLAALETPRARWLFDFDFGSRRKARHGVCHHRFAVASEMPKTLERLRQSSVVLSDTQPCSRSSQFDPVITSVAAGRTAGEGIIVHKNLGACGPGGDVGLADGQRKSEGLR
jgi:hypothetical protein